jgi:hypothetical protein
LASWLALFARQALIEELPQALDAAPDAAWRRFERIFGRDIRRRVARRFPRADQAARDDLFQDVCVGLVEDRYRRLHAFTGKGSFEGFVLTLIDRLLIDLLRKEAPRRRLPAEVERLSGLDQAVFIQAAWNASAATRRNWTCSPSPPRFSGCVGPWKPSGLGAPSGKPPPSMRPRNAAASAPAWPAPIRIRRAI